MSCTKTQDLECVESVNPRRAGRCERCGSPMPELTRRNVRLERQITAEACRGACDSEALIAHGEMRILQSAVEREKDALVLRPGMDWMHEAREELADARNYLVFWWQEEVEVDGSHEMVLEAIKHFAMAYEILREL